MQAESTDRALPKTRNTSRSLWLVRGDEGYGVRRALLGMALELSRRGLAISFAALHPGSFVDDIRSAGYDVSVLSAARVPTEITRRGLAFIKGIVREYLRARVVSRRLAEAVRASDAHWIHLRCNSLLFVAGMAARSCGIPAYWHLPNTITRKIPFGIQAFGYRLLCRHWGVFPLANSRHTADSLGKGQVPIRVLYPGIDTLHFSPRAVFPRLDRSDLGIPAGVAVFVVCARLVAAKAQDRVIAAACHILRAGGRLALLIVGGPLDTPFHAALLDQIRASGCDTLIRLVGPVADPRPYLEIADVVINSRIGAEPFGLSIVEAMLMERPVLAFALGGPSETIDDGKTGWLIDDASVAGYVEGMRRAMADAGRWSKMGRDARLRAEQRFSIEHTADAYLAMVSGPDRTNTNSRPHRRSSLAGAEVRPGETPAHL